MGTVGDSMEEVTKSSYQAINCAVSPSYPAPFWPSFNVWASPGKAVGLTPGQVVGCSAPASGLPDMPSHFRGGDLIRTSTEVECPKWNYIKLRTVLKGDLTPFRHSIHTSPLPRKINVGFEECHCLFVKSHFQKVNTRKKNLEIRHTNLVSVIRTVLALYSRGVEEFKVTVKAQTCPTFQVPAVRTLYVETCLPHTTLRGRCKNRLSGYAICRRSSGSDQGLKSGP